MATLLTDGGVEVHGTTFTAPSAAASAIRGRPTNGWWFFLVDRADKRSLRDVWHEYVDSLAVDHHASMLPIDPMPISRSEY